MVKSKFENLAAALLKAKSLEAVKKLAEELIAEGIVIINANVDLSKEVLAITADFSTAIKQLETEQADHTQTKTDAQGLVVSLKEKLAATEQKVEEGSSAVEVKHGGIAYLVAIPKFKFNGVEYEAKELKSKPSVVAELVEVGAGVLIKK